MIKRGCFLKKFKLLYATKLDFFLHLQSCIIGLNRKQLQFKPSFIAIKEVKTESHKLLSFHSISAKMAVNGIQTHASTNQMCSGTIHLWYGSINHSNKGMLAWLFRLGIKVINALCIDDHLSGNMTQLAHQKNIQSIPKLTDKFGPVSVY